MRRRRGFGALRRPGRSAPGPRWGALLALLAVVACGCSIVTGTTGTLRGLRDDGVSDPSIRTTTTAGKTVVRVQYGSKATSSADAAALNTEAGAVLRTIWTRLPLRFDEVQLVPEVPGEDPGTLTASRSELQSQFGPRPAALDQRPSDIGRQFVTTALVIALVGMVVLIAIVLTILLLVRRSNRNRRMAPGSGPTGWQPGTSWQPATGWQPGTGGPPAWGAAPGVVPAAASPLPWTPPPATPQPDAAAEEPHGRRPAQPPTVPPPGFGPPAGGEQASGPGAERP